MSNQPRSLSEPPRGGGTRDVASWVLLILSIAGLLPIAPIAFVLALSTAQSYAIAGARQTAVALIVICVLFLGAEIANLVVRSRRGQSVVPVAVAVALTLLTAALYLLLLIFGLRAFS